MIAPALFATLVLASAGGPESSGRSLAELRSGIQELQERLDAARERTEALLLALRAESSEGRRMELKDRILREAEEGFALMGPLARLRLEADTASFRLSIPAPSGTPSRARPEAAARVRSAADALERACAEEARLAAALDEARARLDLFRRLEAEGEALPAELADASGTVSVLSRDLERLRTRIPLLSAAVSSLPEEDAGELVQWGSRRAVLHLPVRLALASFARARL